MLVSLTDLKEKFFYIFLKKKNIYVLYLYSFTIKKSHAGDLINNIYPPCFMYTKSVAFIKNSGYKTLDVC